MTTAFPIILASGSPRRKELLSLILGNNFSIIPSNIDESVFEGESSVDYCKRMSISKGYEVANNHNESIVISADTIVVLNDKILGKPLSLDQNILFLKELSSKTHIVYSSCSIFLPKKNPVTLIDKTLVTFRYIREAEIKKYVQSNEGLDKAGGYALQGGASLFIEKIEGSYTNVIGLSVCQLKLELEKLNVIK